MFCEHAMGFEAADLVRDARGRVLCYECTARCEECRRPWYRPALDARGLCEDCVARALCY